MICNKIRVYLDEKKIDNHDISIALHIDESLWKKKLLGEEIITAEEYYTICKLLDVELSFFVS